MRAIGILLALAASDGALAADTGTLPSTAAAESDPVYPAEFYAPFQPQTALDMLERTPGFQIVEGSDLRGFGAAAGNVLISGKRPTVKAGGIGEVLRRIPARQVARVRVLRNARTAEAQGQALIADVVLAEGAGASGTATVSFTRTSDGRVSPTGQVSYSRSLGAWQTNVELTAEAERYPSTESFRSHDAAGLLIDSRDERRLGRAPEYGVTGSTSGPLAGGVLAINGRFNLERYLGRGVSTPVPRRFALDEKSVSMELGTDWTVGIGRGWTAKFVGLARRDFFGVNEDLMLDGYRGSSELRRKPLELVARATLSRSDDERALQPELGAEIAYNRLTSRLYYAEDLGAGPVPVDLGGSDVRASEMRGEVFANLVARIGKRTRLEGGLAAEFSKIDVSGDLSGGQSLFYFKPSAAVVHSLSGSTELRLGVAQTVDQLDFGDFAASVDQQVARPLGGNADLRPARKTRAMARIDYRWGEGGALSLELFQSWHRGLLGYVLLPTGEEALGTIGNGRARGVTVEATVPLGALLAGSRLTVNGTAQTTHFRDPVTGENRRMDETVPIELTTEFRQDIAAWRSSWGVSWRAPLSETVFYNRERLEAWADSVLTGYVETTAIGGIKTTLTVSGIAGDNGRSRRLFYAPDRSGALIGSELRRQRQEARITLTLARSL